MSMCIYTLITQRNNIRVFFFLFGFPKIKQKKGTDSLWLNLSVIVIHFNFTRVPPFVLLKKPGLQGPKLTFVSKTFLLFGQYKHYAINPQWFNSIYLLPHFLGYEWLQLLHLNYLLLSISSKSKEINCLPFSLNSCSIVSDKKVPGLIWFKFTSEAYEQRCFLLVNAEPHEMF